MMFSAQPGGIRSGRRLRRRASLCSVALVLLGVGVARGQAGDAQAAAQQSAATEQSAAAPASEGAHTIEPKASPRQARAAEDAYLAGARKLEHNDLSGAEADFTRAQKLNPANRDYAMAIIVAREHRLTELVQQAGQARMFGQEARADGLMAEARAIDPENPIVLQHSAIGQGSVAQANVGQAAAGQRSGTLPGGAQTLTDRSRLIAASEPAVREVPVVAGAVKLTPVAGAKDFDLRGDSRDVMQQVASAFGIKAAFDDSVQRKTVRFRLNHVAYAQAMGILMTMAGTFATPLDATSMIVAKDDADHRAQFERQMEETIYLPGMTIEQINDLVNVVRTVFDVKQATVQTGLGSIVVRAPEATIGPMNATLTTLMDTTGEVMLELKMYEIDATHTRNIGALIPTNGGVYNVDQAATAVVNANQTLVQQAIAQGYVTATTSNIEIALALIKLGLVSSPLLSSTIGFFGHGLTETGITASSNVTFNFGLNSSDTRALDDVQMRVDDGQAATFRAGTKYPVTTSTYTTGLSTAASALSGATINGVSVASLLAQYAGGSSTTIPQITYEDLGVTVKTTPVIEKSGRIHLKMDVKIEALAGASLNGIPVLNNRSFTSDITVAEGETALMSSYLSRTESAAVTGIPGLSELPGFQAPVNDDAQKDTSQLVLLVTPRVVRRRSNMVAGPRIVMKGQDAAD